MTANEPTSPSPVSPATPAAEPLPAGILCPQCAYDVRTLTSERCPECGFDLNIIRTQDPQIPWSRRRELGRFRAYWKTVWLVIRRPRLFCVEICRPVNYRDAQLFRWVTFLHAYLPILLGSLIATVALPGRLGVGDALWWWAVLSAQIVAFAAFGVLPGVASYFFQSRRLTPEQQNRAIALSYYAWSPLVLAALAPPFLLAVLLLADQVGTGPYAMQRLMYSVCAATGFHVAIALACAVSVECSSKYLVRRAILQRLCAALLFGLFAILLLLAALTFCAGVFYLLVVFDSLT